MARYINGIKLYRTPKVKYKNISFVVKFFKKGKRIFKSSGIRNKQYLLENQYED